MTTASAEVVEGLVLCTWDGARLAVRAQEVVHIEAPPEAAAEGAKSLRARTGALLVVGIEIWSTPALLLPVPSLVNAMFRDALVGFVELGGALWPVMSLERLAQEVA